MRVYLGAAPGVGKTYAMLDEGRRRQGRGAQVLIWAVDSRGRAATEAQLQLLIAMTGSGAVESQSGNPGLLVEGIIARRPDVVLVDDLAALNPPGATRVHRWQDVDELLKAGIDVVTTLNIGELESVRDVVERVTGIAPSGTVPDIFVRSAAQVELVDITPEALRRRLAHGNVFKAEDVDASVADLFEEHRLAALRELTLLWVADGVRGTPSNDGPSPLHRSDTGWETRERIVVAVSGTPGDDVVVRRAARMAQRARATLVAVHVLTAGTVPERGGDDQVSIRRIKELVEELGGRFHTVTGGEIPAALSAFVRAERGTQLVLGVGSHRRGKNTFTRSTVDVLIELAEDFDVHVVTHKTTVTSSDISVNRLMVSVGSALVQGTRLTHRRRNYAALAAIVALPGLTFVLDLLRDRMSLASQMLLYLGLVVVLAAAGGIEVGLGSMIVALVAVNWYFTEPRHTLLVGDAEDVVALFVFGVVTVTVSTLVSQAARRAIEAGRSRTEAELLARASATMVGSLDPLRDLIEQLRIFSGSTYAHIENRIPGASNPGKDAGNRTVIPLDQKRALVLIGDPLSAQDRELVTVFADQIRTVLRTGELALAASGSARLQEANDFRTALLRAVSHDLRSPLSGIKAASSSLLSAEVTWPQSQKIEFIQTIDTEADRLSRLIEELLEMTRLEAGVIVAHGVETDLVDVCAEAVRAQVTADRSRVSVKLGPGAGRARTDPALVERILANLTTNALSASQSQHEPERRMVAIEAERVGESIVVRVVDRGPGLPASKRDSARQPFQRVDDSAHHSGLGLGLAIVDALAKTIGTELHLDDTPGGGLTASIRLPIHSTAGN